jgi:hypothetical protein
VASGDDLAYQWYVSTDGGSNFTAISNGGVYSGVTSATLSLSSGINSSFNNYKYRVNVTNTCDNIGVTSSIVGLTIYSSAYVNITSQPASVTVTQGSSTSFSAPQTMLTLLIYQERRILLIVHPPVILVTIISVWT